MRVYDSILIVYFRYKKYVQIAYYNDTVIHTVMDFCGIILIAGTYFYVCVVIDWLINGPVLKK